MKVYKTKIKINWDALGVGASVACAIHCAVLPLILTSLPLFGINIIGNNGFEIFMIALAFCIGAYSLYHGLKKHHRKWYPLIIFSAGIGFLFAKQIWHQYSIWFLFPAVSFIVTAHYFNFKLCRRTGRSGKQVAIHNFKKNKDIIVGRRAGEHNGVQNDYER